jgi:hypothetical protein
MYNIACISQHVSASITKPRRRDKQAAEYSARGVELIPFETLDEMWDKLFVILSVIQRWKVIMSHSCSYWSMAWKVALFRLLE